MGERNTFRGLVFGLDPSLRGTGMAIVKRDDKGSRLVFSETIKLPPKLSFYDCLGHIHSRVASLADRYQPDVVAVEAAIYAQNYQTAIILGAARGAGLAALAQRGLPIFEYAPLRIKQSIVGYGRAKKEQVAATLQSLLPAFESGSLDETDAAAVALCHILTHREIQTNQPG